MSFENENVTKIETFSDDLETLNQIPSNPFEAFPEESIKKPRRDELLIVQDEADEDDILMDYDEDEEMNIMNNTSLEKIEEIDAGEYYDNYTNNQFDNFQQKKQISLTNLSDLPSPFQETSKLNNEPEFVSSPKMKKEKKT